MVGLSLYGLAMAMIVRAALGQDPWDVFHYGVATHVPVSFGTVVVATSFAVLLLWIPLRQAPGLGTLLNSVWIGVSSHVALGVIDTPDSWQAKAALLVGGVALNGLASALYIGSQLGPGPRDGLMTGLHNRTRLSLRTIRTGLEIAVLLIGWALGGIVGVGTVLYALAIGPMVQFVLPYVVVRLPETENAAQPSE